jgi:hypothetical protein
LSSSDSCYSPIVASEGVQLESVLLPRVPVEFDSRHLIFRDLEAPRTTPSALGTGFGIAPMTGSGPDPEAQENNPLVGARSVRLRAGAVAVRRPESQKVALWVDRHR